MLKRENLSDKLSKIIGRKIIQNELKSGTIIYETQISKEWGTSRSPVRDALRMLEQKKLVERTPKGSYQVAELSGDFLQNFYETVDLLFQYAFAKAAENATEEDLLSLKSALDKVEKSIKDNSIELYLEGTSEFASTILRVSRNPIVERITLELMPNAERIIWATATHLPENHKTGFEYIRRSYQNIAAKKPQDAAKDFADLARIHIETLKAEGTEE